MDSKKIIEALIKIAENQQLIIQKLAQSTGTTPRMLSPAEKEEIEKKYDPLRDFDKPAPTPTSVPSAPSAPTKPGTKYDPLLLAPPGKKLTEEEWRALEKQRGMKPGEATESVEPGWVPQNLQPKAPAAPTSPAGPSRQGGPPGQSKPLTPVEKEYLETLRKQNK